jgi:aldehyde dehydrogenase (NAD+)
MGTRPRKAEIITAGEMMDNYRERFEDQRKYFQAKVRHTSAGERIEKLKRIKSWIAEHRQEIRDAINSDFKKPSAEVDLTDIKPVVSEINDAVSHLRKWMRPKRVRAPLFLFGTRSKIMQEPKGVVLILAPWNFPFMLTIGPLVSAIAAGNCVIVKPSEVTPFTEKLIGRMIPEIFEPQEITVCPGDYRVAEELLKLPFDHIFFTGNPEVGKKVMKAAAENLSSVTLELGGKNPAIVDETADLKDTAEKLIWGKFMNCGQSCMAPNYVMVKKEIHSQLIAELKKAFEKLYPGTDTEKNPDFARLVDPRHFQRVRRLVTETVNAGAELVLGGNFNEDDNYIAPTILNNVPLDAAVMREEIFGPVMPILRYENLDDVIEIINRDAKPLTLYIFSASRSNIKKVIAHTSSGGTCINDTTIPFAHPYLPFGGVNYSGFGKAHGHAGFLDFSNERPILKQKRGMTTLKLTYPPYTRRVKQIIQLVIKYL